MKLLTEFGLRQKEALAECFHLLALPFVEKSVVLIEQIRHGHLQKLRYPGELVQRIGISARVLVAYVGTAQVSSMGNLVGACASEIELDGVAGELRAFDRKMQRNRQATVSPSEQLRGRKIAIYSRKSRFTGKGDSVENQIKVCREYIYSNFEDVPGSDILVFEDEGFSGKNTDRPKFKAMMDACKRKEIGVVVCYRLDRFSRNTKDFLTAFEQLEQWNISFVSVCDRFDTTTVNGWAMMGIVSIFATMERNRAWNTKSRPSSGFTGKRLPLSGVWKKLSPSPERIYIRKRSLKAWWTHSPLLRRHSTG